MVQIEYFKDNNIELLEEDEERIAREEAYYGKCHSLRENIIAWTNRVTFPEFVQDIQGHIIGQEDLEDILFNIYMYISNLSEGRTIRNNILLAAPSGCGKTETYRALKKYFAVEIPEFPVIQVDLSGITPEGYTGGNVTDIVESLNQYGNDGMGIVFMDEFDKCLIPQFLIGKTQLNQEVQNAILTLIEGRMIEKLNINTNNTMFIGMGSFDVFRAKRDRLNNSMRFVSNSLAEANSDIHYAPITMDDMRQNGAIPELLGRFVTIVNYHKLSDEAIDKVIDLNIKDLSITFGIPLDISSKVRQSLHELSNTEYGCRLVNNTLHNNICKILKRNLYEGKKLNEVEVYLESI